MKTTAAVLRQLGSPLEVWDLDLPALERGQVLVQISLSGVCGTQVGEIAGLRGPDLWLPHCLGHEATGVVLNVGPGVTRVRQGDEVIASWIGGSGVLTGGVAYRRLGDVVHAGPIATLQRHAIIGETRLARRPLGVSDPVAVAMGCAAPTGVGAVINVLQPNAGDRMVVFGAGGVGLFAIAGAKSLGVASIVVVDPSPLRRDLAHAWGASVCLDPASGGPEELQQLAGDGFDGCVVATGDPAALESGVSVVRPRGGRVVFIGNSPADTRIAIDPSIFNQGKSILGTWGGDYNPDQDMAALVAVLEPYARHITEMYSTPYSLELVNDAVSAMRRGVIGRALVDMDLGSD